MIEFVSEMFREYWLDSNSLKMNFPEYYRIKPERTLDNHHLRG